MNNELNVTALPGEGPGQARARALTRPEVTNARTLQAIEANLELQALVDTLTNQTQAAAGGDLSRAEEMLAAQAHTRTPYSIISPGGRSAPIIWITSTPT